MGRLEDGVPWAVHEIENERGKSTDVLTLIFYSLSSSTTLKAERWLPTANIIFNRKMKCVFFLLIFFYLFLAQNQTKTNQNMVS